MHRPWLTALLAGGLALAYVPAEAQVLSCPARSVPGCLCFTTYEVETLRLPAGSCDCGAGCKAVDEKTAMERLAVVQAARHEKPTPPEKVGAAELAVSIVALVAILTVTILFADWLGGN